MLHLLLLALFQAPPAGSEDLARERERIERERMLDPEDPELLLAYAEAWGQAKDTDRELAYLLYAWDAFEQTEFDDELEKEKRVKAIETRVKALDPASQRLKTLRDEYLKELSWSLKLYADNQKKPRNALEVAGRILRYRPSHRTARTAVNGLLKEASADLRREAQFLMGVEELRRPLSYRRRWAEEHRAWTKAGSVSRSGYTVHSNIGYDTLQRSATALEQVADFYREFYGVGEAGSTKVYLCRTREEYENVAQGQPMAAIPEVRGFLSGMQTTYSDGHKEYQFSVYSYDPRDDGFALETLYQTLFHEASHQYMAVAAGADQAPSWLDEGMASYFEGVTIGPDGRVAIGLPATRRLHDLAGLLAQGAELLRATLASEPLQNGEQYAAAWGVVYYLYHTHDETGGHPYRGLLRQMIERCASGGSDGTGLFESTVLQAMGVSFDEFVQRWSASIRELEERERDPSQAAEHHRILAEGWLKRGQREAAAEGFLDGLLRMPDDPRLLLGLAQPFAGSKDRDHRDDTLLWARRAHKSAVSAGAKELAESALGLATAADPAGFKKLLSAEASYQKDIAELVERHLAAQRPNSALALTQRYLDEVLGENRFTPLCDELRAKGTLRLERRRVPFDGRTSAGLSFSPSLFRVLDGELVTRVSRPERAPLFLEEPVSPLFRWQGEIQLGDAYTIAAVMVSEPSALGTIGFVLRPPTKAKSEAEFSYYPFDLVEPGMVGTLREGYSKELKVYDFVIEDLQPLLAAPAAGVWWSFALVREEPGRLELQIDGKTIRTLEVSAQREDVRPGLLIYGGAARIRNLSVLEIGRP